MCSIVAIFDLLVTESIEAKYYGQYATGLVFGLGLAGKKRPFGVGPCGWRLDGQGCQNQSGGPSVAVLAGADLIQIVARAGRPGESRVRKRVADRGRMEPLVSVGVWVGSFVSLPF